MVSGQYALNGAIRWAPYGDDPADQSQMKAGNQILLGMDVSTLSMRRTLVILTLGVCAVCPLACSLCTNSPVGEYWSPTHVRRLVVFERSCGSTTGFSTQVSLLPASRDWPRGVGNVFVADDDHGSESLGERHTLKLSALWLTEDRVLISYSAKARVFRRKSEVNGVAIQYNPEHLGW